jgi:tetratricopeptide (TPR) repeat protein
MYNIIKLVICLAGVYFFAGFLTGCGASSGKRSEESITKVPAQIQKPTVEVSEENKSVFSEAVALYQKELAKPVIDYDAMLRIFQSAIDKAPKLAEAYYNLGCIYEAMHNEKKAKENYEQALTINPDLGIAAASLGAILAHQGDLDQALELFKRSLVKDSKNSAVLLEMAEIYSQRKQYDQAIDAASQVLIRDPNNVGPYRIMASVYYDKGDLDMAHLICQRGLVVKDKDPRLLNTLGLVLLRMHKVPEALAQFRIALQKEPDMIQTRFNVAKIALDYKDFRVAREEFQKILAYEPNNIKAEIGLGIAMRGTGDFENALKHFQNLSEKYPKDPLPYYWRGMIHLRNITDMQAAVDEFNTFKKLSGNLPSNHQVHALIKEAHDQIEMDVKVKDEQHKAELEAKRQEELAARLEKQRQELYDQEWARAEQENDVLPPKKLQAANMPFVIIPIAMTSEKGETLKLAGAIFKNIAKVELGAYKVTWRQIDEYSIEIQAPKGLQVGAWDVLITFKDKTDMLFQGGLWVGKKPTPKKPEKPAPKPK